MNKCPVCNAPKARVSKIGQWFDDYCDTVVAFRTYICLDCGTKIDTEQKYTKATDEQECEENA